MIKPEDCVGKYIRCNQHTYARSGYINKGFVKSYDNKYFIIFNKSENPEGIQGGTYSALLKEFPKEIYKSWQCGYVGDKGWIDTFDVKLLNNLGEI